MDWMQLYPESYVHFLSKGLFDHNPCVCYRRNEVIKRRPSFQYYIMWGTAINFKEVVQREWGKPIYGTKMFRLVTKLKSLKKPLKNLNNMLFKHVKKAAVVALHILEDTQLIVQSNRHNLNYLQAEKEVHNSYMHLRKAKLSYLHQKDKTNWLKEGDENTKFFHSHIKARQAHNKVLQIRDKNNMVHMDPEGIETAFLDYYKELLGTHSQTTPVHIPTVEKGKLIHRHHWDILLKPITKEDIR
ncbi:uncharacterized protein LOC141601695 [Silene latifolia]|uniref:uncharacterized protein LOC141601695 n=1 Tax=Silene latifolia TaxID=37657 RepID=UPI003D780D7F